MTEATYIFDDEFFRKYNLKKDDSQKLDIPACHSPYFWIMAYTWYEAKTKFQKQNSSNHLMRLHDINRSELYWNRCFCAKLSSEQKREYNIDDIKPLTAEETEKLQTIIHSHLGRLGIPINKIQNFDSIEKIEFQDRSNLKNMIWESDMDYDFRKFIFPVEIDFIGNTFHEVTDFQEAIFLKKVDFSDAYFLSSVICKQTRFNHVLFHSTKFEGASNFWNAHFLDINDFAKSEFKGDVKLSYTTFKRIASFGGACFRKDITFCNTEFSGGTRFDSAQFREKSTARFDDIICAGEFNFSNVDCHPRFFLTRANLREASLNFEGAYFRDGMNLDSIACPEQAGNTEIHRLSWRELRNIAGSKGDAKQELDFLAYELQARQKNKKDENLSVRLMIKAYGWFSDYGRSIASPIKSWFLLIFIFFSIYGFIFFICALFIYNDQYRYRITLPHALKASSAFALSFYEGSVFLPIADAERYQYLKTQLFTLDCALIKKELQKEYCSPKSDNPKEQSYLMENAYYYYYPMVAGFQKLFSLLLILLLGNSIRNHLRMR